MHLHSQRASKGGGGRAGEGGSESIGEFVYLVFGCCSAALLLKLLCVARLEQVPVQTAPGPRIQEDFQGETPCKGVIAKSKERRRLWEGFASDM